MPGGSRRRDTASTRAAWLHQAYLAHHAGDLDADQLRRTIHEVRRDTPTEPLLDHHAPARTLGEVTPET